MKLIYVPLILSLLAAAASPNATPGDGEKPKSKNDLAIEKNIRYSRLVFVRQLSPLELRLHREQYWVPRPLNTGKDSVLGRTPKTSLPKTPATPFERIKK